MMTTLLILRDVCSEGVHVGYFTTYDGVMTVEEEEAICVTCSLTKQVESYRLCTLLQAQTSLVCASDGGIAADTSVVALVSFASQRVSLRAA